MSVQSKTRNSFERLVRQKGATVHWHREIGGDLCPCLTPEGFRDPEWHRANPLARVCNDDGRLVYDEIINNVDGTVTIIHHGDLQDTTVKGFVQPAFISTRSRSNQLLMQAFGEIQTDDHIGIFPMDFGGFVLDFADWSNSGTDWIEFNNMRFVAVAWNLLPAPDNADVNHHWEVALRRVNEDEPA